jgi:hypothetical protein
VTRKDLGHLLAHAGDAEGEDEAPQRRVARALDARDQVARRLLAHALERRQLIGLQAVQVRGARHHFQFDQLLRQLVAQALDVHGAAALEVQQRADPLRRAVQAARAARGRLARQAHHGGVADRAARGHAELARSRRGAFRAARPPPPE